MKLIMHHLRPFDGKRLPTAGDDDGVVKTETVLVLVLVLVLTLVEGAI